jgi:hypothetical protein
MPNPIKYRLTDIGIDHPAALYRLPEFAVLIALTAATWQGVENELGTIFTVLLGGDEGAALEIFHSLIDRNLRKQALEAVAKNRLPRELLDAVTALFESARRLAGRRNDVVHATWITIPNRPNALMRVDPADTSRRLHRRVNRGIAVALDSAFSDIGGALPEADTPEHELEFSLIEYKEQDFRVLLADINAFRERVQKLANRVLGHVAARAVAERMQSIPPQKLRTLEDRLRRRRQTTPKSLPSSPPEEPPPRPPTSRAKPPKGTPD